MSVANGYDTTAEDTRYTPTKLGAESVLEPIVADIELRVSCVMSPESDIFKIAEHRKISVTVHLSAPHSGWPVQSKQCRWTSADMDT